MNKIYLVKYMRFRQKGKNVDINYCAFSDEIEALKFKELLSYIELSDFIELELYKSSDDAINSVEC